MSKRSRKASPRFDVDRFFDYAVDMLCIADASGYFRRVNRSFERTLGYTAAELLAQPFVEFVHPDDRLETVAETTRLAGGQICLAFENRYLAKDGTYKNLSWTCYPDPKSGLLYAVARDVTEERLRQNRIDGITGVPNRDVWDVKLVGEGKRATRLNVPLALALLDVDRFRSYNDAVGHLEGDRALRRVAEELANRLHREGDLVSRYDGGTFGVLFAGGLDGGAALAHAETLRAAVEGLGITYPDSSGEVVRLTVSGGVASRKLARGEDLSALVQLAQRALKLAKEQGRNRIVPGT